MEEQMIPTPPQSTNGKNWVLPGSIILSAIIIAGALFYNANVKGDVALRPSDDTNGLANVESVFRDVAANEHILGNPNAPVKLIEWSDLECPFCKRFHPTVKQVLAEYGDKVAIVYRHFPLDQLHSKARKEAEATECAAELGGNAKFWEYLDKVFEITPSNNRLDLALLPTIAKEIGLDQTKFESCLASGKYADKVEEDYQDAVAAGGQGTPYSIVVGAKGKIPVNGALPYGDVKKIIDSLLES